MTVSISGTGGVTFADSSVQTTAATGFGFKNRIINGAMVSDQRNAGASVTASGAFVLDRFLNYRSGGAYTVQRSTTAPAGFINSMLMTNTTAASPTTYSFFAQPIEGLNVFDLAFGTASAATITISFWVRSSVTGIYSISVTNSNGDRAYPAQYTINAANTFEYKTITVPGDTSGSWLTNNSTGINLRFDLGSPSGRTAPAGAWVAGNYDGANGSTGGTTWANTTSATFYITGVQLEKGSTATSFDYRPYGTELALCQRYYQKFTVTAGGDVFCSGMMNSTTTSRNFIPFLVPLRTNPTALEQSGTASDYAIFHGGTVTTCSAVPQFVVATVNGASIAATIASGGTAGNGTLLRAATSSAYLGWSAEL
jgi:hypothetical protein